MDKPRRRGSGVGEPSEEATLPPGLTLLNTLKGHTGVICRIAWSPDGRRIASASADRTIRLWDATTGETLRMLLGHSDIVNSTAWSSDGERLASGAYDRTIRLWDANSGEEIQTLARHDDRVFRVAWSPDGQTLASGSADRTIRLWDGFSLKLLEMHYAHQAGINDLVWSPHERRIASASYDRWIRMWDVSSQLTWKQMVWQNTHKEGGVNSLAWSRDGLLASASDDTTVQIWSAQTGRPSLSLEGHTAAVTSVAFSADGTILASKAKDGTVRLVRTDRWMTVAVLSEPHSRWWEAGLAFHPEKLILATLGEGDTVIRIWQLDRDVLYREAETATVTYTSAKIVLVGDSGVGKSGLGMVLAGDPFEPTESSHGRRVWRFDRKETTLSKGHRQIREALLWDLAGQPGYRLVHQLRIDQAVIALVLIDARSEIDPLGTAEYWARAIDQAPSYVPIKKFLVVARIDRGGLAISSDELERFARKFGFTSVFHTSAKTGHGLPELAEAIRQAIPWKELPSTSSPELFAAIKEFLTQEKDRGDEALVEELPALFEQFQSILAWARETKDIKDIPDWAAAFLLRTRLKDVVPEPTLEEFRTCILHLEAASLVDVLNFSALDGVTRARDYVLLQPEYTDAYASAAIMTAREDPRGIGHLLESRVLDGQLRLSETERIPGEHQQRLVLAAVVEQMLRHDITLRERLDDGDYLVFPSEYTRASPYPRPNSTGIAFDFEGATRAIFTTLVVRLAHHRDFKKSDFYRDAACYRTSTGGCCAMVLDELAPGQGRMTAYFEDNPSPTETRNFLRFVYEHLEAKARPNSVRRHRLYLCRACGHGWDEDLIENRLKLGKRDVVCPYCDERSPLVDLLLLLDDEGDRNEVLQMNAEAEAARRRQLAVTAIDGKKSIGEYDVFVCYNTEDRLQAVVLADALANLGIRPWLDVWDLVPGRPWQEGLDVAIDRINSAAVCVGPSGLGPWQQHEMLAFIRRFVSQKSPVIPVLLPGAQDHPRLPPILESFLWVDMREFTPKNTRPLANLVAGIFGRRPVEMDPDRLAEQIAAILSVPIAKQPPANDGPQIVLPVNRPALSEMELEAVRQQTAQLLGISSERLKLVRTEPGSVRVVIEVRDFQAVSRLFAMVDRGDPALQDFFQRCHISREQFRHENQATGEQVRRTAAARREETEAAEPTATLSAVPQEELAKWTGGARLLTLAVVFTDIVNSTKLCNDLGDAQWERIRQQHFGRAVSLVRERGGLVVKNTGDGILALFHSAVEAVDFAVSLHQETGHATVRVRAGIHVGQVSLDGGDAFGRHVNLTARIMAFAKADGVIASNRAKEDIVHRGEPHVRHYRWTEFPAVALKGFPEPLTLWQVDG